MRRILLAIVCVMAPGVRASAGGTQEPVLRVLPALMAQVNAETDGNTIPWFREQEKYDVTVRARYSEEATLVETVKGDYSYTLYRFTYGVERVLDGQLAQKALTFYVERQFPTPESGIVFKDLWPFLKDKNLTFKLRRGQDRLLIVSIEQ